MRPSDLPTAETLAFVLDHLPSSPSRILEVGCGTGELAYRIQSLGHDVIAVDSSTESVLQARQNGVEAIVAKWPEFEQGPFDVILFTRSLHHIQPLARAVEQASLLLQPGGLVVIEDFAFDEASPAIIKWFYDILSLLNVCNRLSLTDDGFGKQLLLGGGRIETWRSNHDHDLSPWPVMRAALKNTFELIFERSAPYLYRYVCPMLEADQKGYGIGLRILDMEKEMGRMKPLGLIGRRLVGRKVE